MSSSSGADGTATVGSFAREFARFGFEVRDRGKRHFRNRWNDLLREKGSTKATGSPGGDSSDDGGAKRRRPREGGARGRAESCGVFLNWLALALPCVSWLRSYDLRKALLPDAIAGVSVALMAIPQSISYASLAGLPSEFGLYTCLLPVLVYALFGSSRQLAVGPVAIVSLLLQEGLHRMVPESLEIKDPNKPQGELQQIAQGRYNLAAMQVTLFVGIVEFGLGLIRLGFLTNFLSHSVILGFTHGGAILIGLSQLKHVIGLQAPKSKGTVQDMIKSYASAADTFDWRVLLMGLGFLAMLLAMKEVGKRGKHPILKWLRTLGPLTVSIIAIMICYFAKLGDYGIPLVGPFQGGFPPVTYGELFPLPSQSTDFWTTVVTCAVVGFLESVSIAKRLAIKNKYALYSNQELRALGLANLIGAGFSSYPATGSFSRSAVSNDTGCKTQLAGVFTALVVLVCVLALTQPFYYMPTSALGAIVISGVLGLLDFTEALFLFKLSKVDFLVYAASFLGTLFLGTELGLAIAIGLALLFVIYESAFPQVTELGRLANTTVYRSVKQYPEAIRLRNMLILRVGAPIYFANCSYVRDTFEQHLGPKRKGKMPSVVALEMGPVSHVDATGVHELKDMVTDLKSRGIRFVLCNPNPHVVRAAQNGGLLSQLGKRNVFVRVHDAVKECLADREAQNGDTHRAEEDPDLRFFDDLRPGAQSGDDTWHGDLESPRSARG